MNLQQLTSLVSNLTQQMQQIQNSAKRIDELPETDTIDLNSKLHISEGGVSKALLLQKIVDAVMSLNFDRLVSVGDITIIDDILTVPAGAQWIIGGINYFNNLPVEFEIPYTSDGMTRIDLIYADADGQILRREGIEDDTIWREPNLIPNTVKVTSFTVTDSSIGSPEEPITGSTSVSKESQGLYNELGTGTVQLVFQPNGANKYLIRNATRVDGFKFAITPEQQQSGWPGKPFFITNKTNTDLPLTRNKFGIIKLLWPSEGDMILPKDATAMFYYATEMHLVGNEFNKSKPQKTVTGNVTVDNSWNGAIVKVKASAIITIPSGLIKGFEFDYLTEDCEATLMEAEGVTFKAPSGKVLGPNLMGTLLKDSDEVNTFLIRGDQNE